ncbi:MAG TPA: murein biosynthesis integral membrane protein MurJ [Candidatus Limnocylindrales bacterium]|nr:murein biosynthesis integral membrane protein MurJ [Candidatus Limnocylindrales bacterium]
MANKFLSKSLDLLTKRQSNILSAAFVIMGTVILSQILGLIKKRLLISYFGASVTTGVFDVASKLPDLLFQLVIASALSSAFIPVFSDLLSRGDDEKAHKMASNLLTVGIVIFSIFSIVLSVFAPFFLKILNPGGGFSPADMELMANLMRIIIFGQLLIVIGTFFTALLQSYNHFFVPGFSLALYNFGIIIGLVTLSPYIGIYSGAIGSVIGAIFFILFQLPMVKKVGFNYTPSFSLKDAGVKTIAGLMWPRTISNAIFQFGTILIVSLVSFLPATGRNYIIFDLAQTIAFAPVALMGQSIAQAAFPILARERNNLENFKQTFINSFNQMLYMILPVSVLILILRIPIVRLVFGAPKLDWPATVLTGRILAVFAMSIFAQALIALVYRAFYALHDTKTPLITGTFSTILMLLIGYVFIVNMNMGIASIAVAYSIAGIIQLFLLLYLLHKKTGGFHIPSILVSWIKIGASSFFTAFALYIPIKLLDQLVFDTTRTVNLIILTGISSFAGLSLYLFLTWFFDVKEAKIYVLAIQKMGNWREVASKIEEVIGRDKEQGV